MSSVNVALLKGNLTHEPYFDLIPGSGMPFLRFYLGVNLPEGLGLTYLLGNVVQPPYFDRVGEENRPFMRLFMAVDRPPSRQRNGRRADFLRVVAYGDTALFSYPYLKPGSQILACGNLRARQHKHPDGERTVVELIAEESGLNFIRKIKWREGDEARERILAERGKTSHSDEAPSLPGGGFFRVVTYGELARVCYPYLRTGSKVFVRGELQSRKVPSQGGGRDEKTVVEIVAQEITFLKNIEWEAGNAVRDSLMREEVV